MMTTAFFKAGYRDSSNPVSPHNLILGFDYEYLGLSGDIGEIDITSWRNCDNIGDIGENLKDATFFSSNLKMETCPQFDTQSAKPKNSQSNYTTPLTTAESDSIQK